jgi:hypothetical protein
MLFLTIGWIIWHPLVTLLSSILLDVAIRDLKAIRRDTRHHRVIDLNILHYHHTRNDHPSFNIYNHSNEQNTSFSFFYSDEISSDCMASSAETCSSDKVDGFTLDRNNLWLDIQYGDNMRCGSEIQCPGWYIGYHLNEHAMILAYGIESDLSLTGSDIIEWHAIYYPSHQNTSSPLRFDIWHLLSLSWHDRYTNISSYRLCHSLAYATLPVTKHHHHHRDSSKALMTTESISWNELELSRQSLFGECDVEMVRVRMWDMSKHHLHQFNHSLCNIQVIHGLDRNTSTLNCPEDVIRQLATISSVIEYLSLDEYVQWASSSASSLNPQPPSLSVAAAQAQLDSFRRLVHIIRAAAKIVSEKPFLLRVYSYWRYLYLFPSTNCDDEGTMQLAQQNIVEAFYATSNESARVIIPKLRQSIHKAYELHYQCLHQYQDKSVSMQALLMNLIDAIKACIWDVGESARSISDAIFSLCASYPSIVLCQGKRQRHEFVLSIYDPVIKILNASSPYTRTIDNAIEGFEALLDSLPARGRRPAIALHHLLSELVSLPSHYRIIIPVQAKANGRQVAISSEADAFIVIFVDQADLLSARALVQNWKEQCHHRLCSLYMRFFIFPYFELSYSTIYQASYDLIRRFTSDSDLVVILIGMDSVLGFPQPAAASDALFPRVSYGQQEVYGLQSGRILVSKSYKSLATYAADLHLLLDFFINRDRIPPYTAFDEEYYLQQLFCQYSQSVHLPLVIDELHRLYDPDIVTARQSFLESSLLSTQLDPTGDQHTGMLSCPTISSSSPMNGHKIDSLQVSCSFIHRIFHRNTVYDDTC